MQAWFAWVFWAFNGRTDIMFYFEVAPKTIQSAQSRVMLYLGNFHTFCRIIHSLKNSHSNKLNILEDSVFSFTIF
jgi:hypothetical protein